MKTLMSYIVSIPTFFSGKGQKKLFKFTNQQKALEQMPHYWAMVPLKVKSGKDMWEN